MSAPKFSLRGPLIMGVYRQAGSTRVSCLPWPSSAAWIQSLLFSELLCGPLFTLTPPKATPAGFFKNSLTWGTTREMRKRLAIEFRTQSILVLLPTCWGQGGLGGATARCPWRCLGCFTCPESPQEFHSALGLCCSWNQPTR